MPKFFYVCCDRDDVHLSSMGGVWINDTYGWRFNMAALNEVSEYLNSIVVEDNDEYSGDFDDNEEEEETLEHHHSKRRSGGLHRECSFEIDFVDEH
jgi:hypothetical protein